MFGGKIFKKICSKSQFNAYATMVSNIYAALCAMHRVYVILQFD